MATSTLPGSAVVIALGQRADRIDFNVGGGRGGHQVGGNGGGGEGHEGEGEEREMHGG